MKYTLSVLVTTVLLLLGSSIQPTSAATKVEATLDGGTTQLVRYDDRLFAINVSTAGDMSVWRRNNRTKQWTDVSSSPSVSGLTSSLTSVKGTITFKGKLYIGGSNADGQVELWRKCLHCGQPWQQVNEDGFNIGSNEFIDAFKVGGQLYVMANDPGGDVLFTSNDGETWEQVGSAGLGMDVDMLAAGVLPGGEYVIMAGKVGSVTFLYRADVDDMTIWEETLNLYDLPNSEIASDSNDSDPTITTIVGGNIAVYDSVQSEYTEIFNTEDGLTFTKLGESGLNTNDPEIAVAKLKKIEGELYASGVQAMPSLYKYVATNNTWEVVQYFNFNTRSTYSEHPNALQAFINYGQNWYAALYNENGNKLVRF